MPKTILLANRYSHHSSVEEQGKIWLFELLGRMELDLEVLDEASSDIVLDYLLENQVEIMDYPDIGAIKVTLRGEVAGEWAGPSFTLKKDSGSGDLYYEIELEHWTIFDEE
jgi:hypothetical protein